MLGHRLQAKTWFRCALGGSTQVRHDHDRRAFFQCHAQRRNGRQQACIGSDLARADGHVEVFADQHALAVQVDVLHGQHYLACISAVTVSSMRLEKPHSLSYQLNTLTWRDCMTLVSVASKMLEAGL
jgi:hypothetical protein